jgi:ribosomal protein S18 acetylase RimI-like enzyme
MDDIEHEFDSPLASVTDVLPRISPNDQALVFGARGFWHREKVVMRRGPEKPAGIRFTPSEVRTIRESDLEAVVGIYVRAYSERPGEFWTWGRPDNWANARDDVMSHIDSHGKWSPNFLADASVVWDAGGRVVGAVLVEENQRDHPFVEDAIVEPEFHRRGIGRALMSAAIDRIMQEKPRSIELAATRFGAPYRLYQRLGFDEVPPPAGSLDGDWVRGPSPF